MLKPPLPNSLPMVRRRATLFALYGLWLSGCGGGQGDGATESTGVEPTATSDADVDTNVDGLDSPLPDSTLDAPVPDPLAPVSLPGDPPQFRTWDGGSGPTRDFWSRHLQLRWKHAGVGDWRDAAGTAQGRIPYATQTVSAAGRSYAFDVTALVQQWVRSAENRGAMLRATGASSATWAGRETADATHRPALTVQTDQGTFHCPCLALASFSPTTSTAPNTRLRAKSQPSSPVIAQFDLHAIRGTVLAATMSLWCEAKSSQALSIEVFEADPPRFQLGTGGASPRLGLAGQFPRDVGLSQHPGVIRAGDFSDLTPGRLFDFYNFNVANNPYELLADPDAPGTTCFRGSFLPSPTDKGIARGSFTGKVETMRARTDDPLRPPTVVTDELFCRLYFLLEDDWDSVRDGNKMAIGWDLRMGWWNDAQRGYWQSTTGNGGAPGTGLKLRAPAFKNGGSQRNDRWEYQGHSIRMEAGKGTSDGNPYGHLRPIQSYAYNLDQPGSYGQLLRLGSGVISKGRWHCIEQQIRMNSITGPFDSLGNGVAVADGLLRTWLDGVPCSEISTLRWRRHPDMGIQGPWVNWFYGGKKPSEVPMHYRMNHFAVARQYIGPRVA